MLRFTLVSLAVFLMWPLFAPGYVRLIGFVMLKLLHLFGFDATLLPAAAGGILQYEIVSESSRGVVSPFADPGPILLNMITLIALFSGAIIPPRPRLLGRLGVAALALVLFQGLIGAVMTILALPRFAASDFLNTLASTLLAARAFVPILLWLALDSGARQEMIARLNRAPSAAPAPRS